MDVVEEIFDFLLNVHVVDEEIVGTLEGDGGEIDDAFDAGFLEGVDHALRGGLGDGERGNADLVFLDEIADRFHMQDRDGGFGIEHLGIGVERGDDADADARKAVVVHERLPELAASDDDDFLLPVFSEQHVELGYELVDAVAATLVAGEVEHGKVLAHQRR